MTHRSIKKWPQETKDLAIQLRSNGYTYGQIVNKLRVSKSTLFSWIGFIKKSEKETKEERDKHMAKMRILAVVANKKKRTDRLESINERVSTEVSKYDLNNSGYIRSLLSMLYWAEGTKGRGQLIFANTDPTLILFFITLLRKAYNIDESKFHIRLHLHYYHKIKETRKFWSKLLNIPEAKFGKIYIKKRSVSKKFRKNFAGICFIRYYSEDLRYEVLETARAISEKFVPVA